MKAYITLIMSMVLFMHLSLSINRARIENTTYMQETRYYNNAISLAQSLLDDAGLVDYDQLRLFAYSASQESFVFEGDTYDVQVSTSSVSSDDHGQQLTEDADLTRLQVLVTKADTNVYVRLSQIFSDEGV